VTAPAQPAPGGACGTQGEAAASGGADDPASAVRKGMTLAEAEVALGHPADQQEKELDGMKQTACTYQYKDKTIHADFVNGILVKYAISSR
jgi:hypothetical protein